MSNRLKINVETKRFDSVKHGIKYGSAVTAANKASLLYKRFTSKRLI